MIRHKGMAGKLRLRAGLNFAIVVALGVLVIAAWRQIGAQDTAVEPSLTVHEWGTFTSIAGNDGNVVQWMPLTGDWPNPQTKDVSAGKNVALTDSDLPSFVEHFGYAGFKSGLQGTVRMETPVLYFYAPRDLTVSVHVGFSKGIMTEWYPHASHVSGFSGYSSTSLYKNHAEGTIEWNSVHLEPGSSANFPREGLEHHYYAARETTAAPVRVEASSGDQHEKFLFYRGVSSMSVPISARVAAEGRVLVTNLGEQAIPTVILFERRQEKIGYRIRNGVEHEVTLDPPELTANIGAPYRDLEEILVSRGLYRDEAHAMLQTWRDSWFEQGSRLFYILPQTQVDKVLPLTINPAPAQTVRVFVGRIELVTSTTEQEVETAVASHDSVMLKKYSRFLQPILEIMKERNPERAKRLSELMGGCGEEVASKQ